MNILEQIVEKRKVRVSEAKQQISLEEMKEKAEKTAGREPFQFEQSIRKDEMSFILEVKKASPSKGIIANSFPYIGIAKEYESAGASAISVLTEPDFFMGRKEYVSEIGRNVSIPILRKDFIIDPYQIYESKVIGADAILLICSILTSEELNKFHTIATSLGLSCLVEAHNEEEITQAIEVGAKIIGVNNRDLKDFNVSVRHSQNLRGMVPEDILFVSESGIKTREDVMNLEMAKVDAVLIGETMMRARNRLDMLRYLKGEQYE